MATSTDPTGTDQTDRPTPPPDPARTVRGLILFVVVAFALAWLSCAPLWLSGGLHNPLFGVCATAMMFTPTIAALVVTLTVERRHWRRRRGADGRPDPTAPQPVLASLGLGAGARPGRFVRGLVVALVGTTLLILAALALSALVGTYPGDAGLPMLAGKMGSRVPGLGVLWLLAAVQIVVSMITGLINVVATLGEEIGWRGYLLPRLDTLLPRPAAIVIMGVIWGLWHAPLILLGYDYPDHGPVLGLATMVVFTVLVGSLLAWLRFRYASVWPTAVAHATINTMVTVTMLIFLATGARVHTLTATLMGWPGWVLMVILIAVLFGVPALRPGTNRHPAEPVPPAGSATPADNRADSG